MVREISSTTVVVLDRQPLFRLGVVSLLRDAHPRWVCSDAGQLDDVHPVLMEHDRVVVLVDPQLPDIAELGGIRELVASYPQHLFVATSDSDDRVAILACLTAGARGYILRSASTTQFLRAIDTIIAGGVFAPASLTAMSVHPAPIMMTPVPLAAPLANLTDRQRDVFNLLVEGCATKTIARRLDLAVGTVKVHLAAIYRTLGANSRLEAVAKAHRYHAHG
jgi:DNA-binding NarL/FixJ family response regulator